MQKNSAKNFMKPKYLEKSFTRTLTFERQQEYAALHATLKKKLKQDEIKNDFMAFVKEMWPEFIEGRHHTEISKKFNDIAKGKIKRLIINMPPRHTKSEFASFLLPSWMVGRKPDLKIIQTSNTTELALRFGRKAKTLIDSPEYQKIFQTRLREDSQAAGKWETEQGGEYYAAGVGSAITGRGADLLIVVMTRWSLKDLTGALLNSQKNLKADQWHVVEFPAIMPSGKPIWPEYWKKDELEGVKASLSIGKWNAQWMQNPTSEEGSIIKRDWWQLWEKPSIPPLQHIIQSYDTAFSKKETADYSAITTWGVFYPDEDSPANLILLDAYKERLEFPELRKEALEQYKYWNPDTVIIEAKASGQPLTYELRKIGIPVINFTPSKGQDKYSRVNAVAPMFESGMIWAPDEEFADEVIEECASFPYGDHDDLVDSTTQALMRFRQGGFVNLPDDYKEDPLPRIDKEYY
jgi:predicted phage terminase large subunit-like protein